MVKHGLALLVWTKSPHGCAGIGVCSSCGARLRVWGTLLMDNAFYWKPPTPLPRKNRVHWPHQASTVLRLLCCGLHRPFLVHMPCSGFFSSPRLPPDALGLCAAVCLANGDSLGAKHSSGLPSICLHSPSSPACNCSKTCPRVCKTNAYLLAGRSRAGSHWMRKLWLRARYNCVVATL